MLLSAKRSSPLSKCHVSVHMRNGYEKCNVLCHHGKNYVIYISEPIRVKIRMEDNNMAAVIGNWKHAFKQFKGSLV